MRHPRRWRAAALAALPLGLLLVLVADRQASEDAAVMFGAAGACVLLFGVLMGGSAHRAARAQARLARGEGVLARWRVAAADWQAFLARERELGARDDSWPNAAPLPEALPPEGIDIVIGEDAWSIDGSLHLLPRHGMPEVIAADLHALGEGDPGVAELQLRHPPTMRRNGEMTDPVYTRLAVPLPLSAWRDARKAIAFYARGRPGKAGFFHGRGDGSDPEDLSTCPACGHRTHMFRATCPECGAGIVSRRWTRRYGWVLAVLGGLLTAGMAILLWKLSPMLANPGVTYGKTRFAGSFVQALVVWAVLGAVLAFGLTALGGGAWQVATGRRNLRVAWVLSTIFSGLAILASVLAVAGE